MAPSNIIPQRSLLSRFSEIDECTIPISNTLSLRISSDTKPRNFLIADLQKGLRLINKSRELVGEGAGLGVPVLLYSDDTFFSGSSRVYLCQQDNLTVLQKEFIMDTVQRKKIRGVNLENRKIRAVLRYMEKLYQKYRRLQSLASTNLVGRMGIHFGFAKTETVGRAIVTYFISGKNINVKADLSLLKRGGLRKIFLLNEQGSTFFRRYSSSEGIELVDEQVGAWRKVEGQSGSITDIQNRVGFRLWKKKGSGLHIGREFLGGYTDWIGLDYEIRPGISIFEYKIRIL